MFSLSKFRKLNLFSNHKSRKQSSKGKKNASVLRIIHPGGIFDCYYVPTTAAKVMENYPGFLLTSPDVFRRPWDSIIMPEQILRPGEKFFAVPCGTVRKLQRKIRRPPCVDFSSDYSFALESSNDNDNNNNKKKNNNDNLSADMASPAWLRKGNEEKSVEDDKPARLCCGIRAHKRKIGGEEKGKRSTVNESINGNIRKKKAENIFSWQPTLEAITESCGADD